jgi:hypothetical protein
MGGKEKVDLFDQITSAGADLDPDGRRQAKSGHDVMGLRTWYVSAQVDRSCRSTTLSSR